MPATIAEFRSDQEQQMTDFRQCNGAVENFILHPRIVRGRERAVTSSTVKVENTARSYTVLSTVGKRSVTHAASYDIGKFESHQCNYLSKPLTRSTKIAQDVMLLPRVSGPPIFYYAHS